MEEHAPRIISTIRPQAIILAGFAATFVCIAVIGFTAYWNLHSLGGGKDQATHVYRVIDHLQALRFLIDEAETRERDYLITGDQYNLEMYQAARTRVDQEKRLLEALTRGDGDQQQRLKLLAPMIDTRLSTLEDSVEVRNQMGPQSALDMIRSSSRRSLMDDVLRRVSDMIDEERLLLPLHEPDEKLAAQSTLHIIIAGCGASLTLLGITVFCVLRMAGGLRARVEELSHRDTDLRTQSQFMDAVLNNMDEGVVVLDRDMKVVQSNPVATRLLGASKAQMVEEFKAEFEPSSAGGGLTLALEHFQASSPSVAGPEAPEPGLAGDPGRVSMTASARVLRDEAGGLRGGVLFLRDVTEHKRMERQLRTNETSLISLFHYGLEAGFIVALEDSICIGVNEGFLKLSGYLREELLGQTIEELSFCRNSADLRLVLEQARIGQASGCPLRLCTKSGRTFEAALSALRVEIGGEACILFAIQRYSAVAVAARPVKSPSQERSAS
jgi:PAS domain S-box-containing protein